MTSDDAPANVSAPPWVVTRLNQLATYDPLRFTRQRVPALDHRTIAEVLATPTGVHEIEQFLTRLEAKVGTKRNPDDFQLRPGLNPLATQEHPDFERLNVDWVRHTDGWSVGLLTGHVGYRIEDRMARLEADLDAMPDIVYHPDTLTWIAPRTVAIDAADREQILDRMLLGLHAFGAAPRST